MQCINLSKFLSIITLIAGLCLAEEPTTGALVAGTILPSGSFPSVVANQGYGGWHITTNPASIPPYLLAVGTAAWNITDTNLYIWDGTLWNLEEFGITSLEGYSVEELTDVTSSGSGFIITDFERQHILALESNKVDKTSLGITNGVATLDSNGLLKFEQVPAIMVVFKGGHRD